jgi:hypothetical protein
LLVLLFKFVFKTLLRPRILSEMLWIGRF